MKKSTMAFLAGVMFALAGVIETTVALSAGSGPGHSAAFSAGMMFACVGMMWVGIGATMKKKEDAAKP